MSADVSELRALLMDWKYGGVAEQEEAKRAVRQALPDLLDRLERARRERVRLEAKVRQLRDLREEAERQWMALDTRLAAVAALRDRWARTPGSFSWDSAVSQLDAALASEAGERDE